MRDNVNKLRQTTVNSDNAKEREEGVPENERTSKVERLPALHHLLNGEDEREVGGGDVDGPVPVGEGHLLDEVADGNEGPLEEEGVLEAGKASEVRLPAVVVVDDVVGVVAVVGQLVPEELVGVGVWLLVEESRLGNGRFHCGGGGGDGVMRRRVIR